jgi:hypothetical protein
LKFSVVLFRAAEHILEEFLNQTTTASSRILSNSSFIYHPTIRRYMVSTQRPSINNPRGGKKVSHTAIRYSSADPRILKVPNDSSKHCSDTPIAQLWVQTAKSQQEIQGLGREFLLSDLCLFSCQYLQSGGKCTDLIPI